MPNSVPMWWMRRQIPQAAAENQDEPAQKAPQNPLPKELAALSERFRTMEPETLLLLALLWLLYQEKADKKLLLALAYIII